MPQIWWSGLTPYRPLPTAIPPPPGGLDWYEVAGGAHWPRDISPRLCGKSRTASVPCMEKLAPWATWSLLRYCVNERINYLTQVTEFPLVQDSLALMDDIIDNAILRAGGLPLAPPDSLAHLTMFTLRSLPCDLDGGVSGVLLEK